MKQLYRILFLFFLLLSISELNAKISNSYLSNKTLTINNINLAVPTATITGDATVCQNATNPVITFTGSGGIAPYTFTYKINSGADIISAPSSGDILNINAPTGIAGSFVYTLISVKDSTNSTQDQTGAATITIKGLPTVDFTFTDNQCSGTAVQFTTTSSGSSYTWNFGDSTTSTQQNPSHIFNSLGCGTASFNVSLTITDANGCSNSVTHTVKIKQQPYLKFEDTNATGAGNQFNNCSNAASNSTYSITVGNVSNSISCISSYSINWGDSPIIATNVIFPATHVYNQIGVYDLVITAIGTNGCSNTKTYIVKNVSNPLGGLNSPGSTQNICAPTTNLQFSISNWGTNSPDTTYTVDYGDNSPKSILTQDTLVNSAYYNPITPSASTSYPIPHIYTSTSCPASSFIVKLDIKNACGTTPLTLANITILTKPVANFMAPIIECLTTNVAFKNTTIPGSDSGCIGTTKYIWNFGDPASGTSNIINTGFVDTIPNANHIFSSSGNFTVTLTAQNSCGTTTKTQQICIEAPLAPQFTLNTNSSCAPLAITANNTTIETNSCTPPTYLWKVTYANGYCGIGTVTIPDQNTKNASYNFTVPGTYSITLTATNSCGAKTSPIQTVIVKQPPTVSINAIPSFCQNQNLTPVAITNTCTPNTGTTYLWTFIGGIPATATTKIPPAITYSVAGNYSVSLAVKNECGTTTVTSNTFAVQVAPFVQNEITAVCSGEAFSITPSSTTSGNAIPVGTTYTWSVPVVTGGMTGGVSGNNQAIISGTLINTTATAQTATYTITPKIGTCSGNTFTLIVTVKPIPIISGATNVCVGSTTTLIGSTTPDPTTPWVSSNPTIATVSNTGVVNGIAAGTAAITYTNTNGCQKTVTITVNAIPTVTVNNPVVCSGVSTTVTATPGAVANYLYAWTVPAGFTNPGNVASFSTTMAGTYSVIITNTTTLCVSSIASGTVMANALPILLITNPSVECSPKTIDITNPSITIGSDAGLTFTYWKDFAATIILTNPSAISVSGTYYVKGVNATNCYLVKPVVVTVNPTPTITTIPNIVKCNNQPSGAINFTSNVAGTLYTWTNNTPSIGLGASGSGNIASFTDINTSTSPVIATVTVTPSANGCIGTPKSFTITVNPTPTVDQPSNQEVCNGFPTNEISFAGNIPTSIYSWTNDKPSIGIATSGTGDIPSFTAINTTSAPVIANFTVTTSINGCPGTAQIFKITVNPSPAITFSPSPQTICSGGNSALVTLNSTTSGVNFGWTATQPIGITETIQTSGTTTIPAQTLTNTTNADVIIKYEATATVAGGAACMGAVYTYNITVKPKPSITTPFDQTICSNSAFSITPSDGSGNSIPAGTFYIWSAAAISPVGAITGANAQNSPQSSISQTLVNVTDQTATATYIVTPKSGTCVGNPFQVVVAVNPSPKVVFSGVNQKICSGTDSAVINLSSPTTGNVTFNWMASIPVGITGATACGTNQIPVQNLSNSTTNPLTVVYTATATITDGIACQGPPFTYKITVNPAIMNSSTKSDFNGFNVSSVGASDGSIDVTVSGGSGTYTYLWSGPNGFSAASQDISNVPAGFYTLTINDGLCAPVELNFTLLSPMPMIIQEDILAHKNIFCNGYLTGEIKVDVTQQSVGPYVYVLTLLGVGFTATSIKTAAISYTFTGLKAGVYDIKVSDANGSVKTILGIIITEPSGITASINGQTNVLCFGDKTGSATVTASGGSGVLTYSWNTNPEQTTVTATGLTAGNYTVTITDANSCATNKQVIITEPPILSTTISSQTNVLCFGNSTGAATIAASGGKSPYTFSWDTSPIITSATATVLEAGTYNVTVTDANNCTKVQQVIITQPTGSLSSSITNYNNVNCFGGSNGSATVTVTNGTLPYTYSWNTIPIQTSATANGLPIGNYLVTVTDFNGCITTASIAITQPLAISTSISAQTNVACSGSSTGSATILPNGGTAPYTYSWNTNPAQTSATGINLAMGTYAVKVTDANNCSTIQQVYITEPNGIVTAITSQINVDCFGKSTGSATISAAGGTAPLTYSWNTAITNTTLSATGLVAGTYHLTVTDANGCQKIQEVIITEPVDILITTDSEKDIICFGNSNGEIQITVIGGTPVYRYAWTKNGNPFSILEDLSGLSPGIYQVTVSDANNCGPKMASFTITEPPVLDLTFVNQTNILCFGTSTGSINVNVVGGTPSVSGYNFAWTGSHGFTSTNQNLSAIAAGTYNLTVTDNLGCTNTLTVILTQPSKVVVAAQITPIICYGVNDGSIKLTISGGVGPYTVLWNNMGSGVFQDNLSAGDYLATITDNNNCVTTINLNIPEPPIFTIKPVTKNISCFGAHDGSINLNIMGGIAPVVLKWDDSTTAGNVRNNLGPGSYTVTITDSKPCIIKRTFIIQEPQLLVLSANLTNALDCDNANSGAINLLVSGGSAPFTYAWSNGSTNEDLSNISAGNYLVTVTDARGCVKTAQYSINRPPPIVVGVETKTDFNCDTKVVKQSFIAQVSGGVPPYQNHWSSGTVSGVNNEIMNTNQNGTVILDVTDNLGCKANYTFNVAVPKLGSPFFTTSSVAFSTYGLYSIEDPIQFTNVANGDYLSIAWDFGDGTFHNEANPIHIYKKEGNFVVNQIVTYSFGCVYIHTISLEIKKGYGLIPPTGFTPNGDEINDYFAPVFSGLKEIHFDVYDTWGGLIYSESGDNIRGWDGKINFKEAENGNYYFKISAKTFYGTTIKDQGAFVLIK